MFSICTEVALWTQYNPPKILTRRLWVNFWTELANSYANCCNRFGLAKTGLLQNILAILTQQKKNLCSKHQFHVIMVELKVNFAQFWWKKNKSIFGNRAIIEEEHTLRGVTLNGTFTIFNHFYDLWSYC